MAATIIIVAAVGLLVFFAVRKMVKDRKSGAACAGCGGGCGNCGGCGEKDGGPHAQDRK